MYSDCSSNMTRAQCYYEILGVDQSASSDDIKKAYRNLALVWHPDKNQSNPDETHAKFQSILKAYETLSDSRERDWYDRHKDQILSGCDEDATDKYINLFQYFSSCYSNFDDADDGFYTIYREVFKKIAEEETDDRNQLSKLPQGKSSRLLNDRSPSSVSEYPTFGRSDSDYETVVKPFYAFWSSFCTRVRFDHLDKYNTLEAENRRMLKAMEKENKKIKDQAKKERNTNVRNLVEFIKKRDRRLKAHKLIVEQQNELNRQKTAEKQRLQRQKCQKETSEYQPTAWADLSDIEAQLQQLEDEYVQHDAGKKNRGRRDQAQRSTPNNPESLRECIDEDESEPEEVDFFCPACNKQFKSLNAYENHEASKKHKQNVAKLMDDLKDDEKRLAE